MSKSLFHLPFRPTLIQSSTFARQFTSTISRQQPPPPATPSSTPSSSSSNSATQTAKTAQLSRDQIDARHFITDLPLNLNLSHQISANRKEPYHLHCYTTKHNTHVTLSNDKRDSLISISCGNLGFKKGARGTYEAAFQTSAWVMRQMHERGYLSEETNPNYVYQLEVVLRGFGEGRQAFTQALMGIEGRNIRPKVVKVSDATRIKFGGARSPNPRRLG